MKPIFTQKLYRTLFLPLLIVLIIPAQAQQYERDKLTGMIEEDRTTIDAIAGYDEDVRQNILRLSQTPEVLNIIEELQKKSEKKFRNIIRDYDRNGQEALYEMARYPDLISELVAEGKPSSSEINLIIARYPSDIRETAKKYARSHYEALRDIDNLNNEIDREFQSYLTPYDEQTRSSVNVLLKYPEIVAVLVEDKDFTRTLGLAYNEDPGWVTDQLNIISEELEKQNQKDLAEYKEQIQNDPEAYQEMLQAGEKFAGERNITRRYDPYNADVEIIINSYPFWYGYPYWYPYPYWRPYPVYYHTGFYIGPGRSVIFVGLPSSHFIYWHTHYHPQLYPHLSYNYYNYYQRHYLPYRNHVHRPVAHYGFYHSVERHVVNNPRVNNDNLVRIDRKRGSNIIKKPDYNRSYEYSRRSSSVRSGTGGNILRPNSSARRDAFPKTSPSPVRAGSSRSARTENSLGVISGSRRYERPATKSVISGNRRNEAPSNGSVRSDSKVRPSYNSRANGSTVKNRNEVFRRPEGQQNTVRKSPAIPQKSNTQASPSYRNYRNYKATESRQANPSSLRRSTGSSQQRISAPSGNQPRMSGNPRQSSGASRSPANRSSREK